MHVNGRPGTEMQRKSHFLQLVCVCMHVYVYVCVCKHVCEMCSLQPLNLPEILPRYQTSLLRPPEDAASWSWARSRDRGFFASV